MVILNVSAWTVLFHGNFNTFAHYVTNLIYNKQVMAQAIARRNTGDKPLSELKMFTGVHQGSVS